MRQGLTEDDTFKKLKCVSFEEVVRALAFPNTPFDTAYNDILWACKFNCYEYGSYWADRCGGWKFDDFRLEAIRRYDAAVWY